MAHGDIFSGLQDHLFPLLTTGNVNKKGTPHSARSGCLQLIYSFISVVRERQRNMKEYIAVKSKKEYAIDRVNVWGSIGTPNGIYEEPARSFESWLLQLPWAH